MMISIAYGDCWKLQIIAFLYHALHLKRALLNMTLATDVMNFTCMGMVQIILTIICTKVAKFATILQTELRF